jgi:L-arabinose isomerase
MNTQPQAGLLPFYLKLYDDILPESRAGFAGFIEQIAAALEARGISVQTAAVCRVATEFEVAIKQFEQAGVDCILTLHLAYSPSLEAIGAFCQTQLPIVILDTTIDADFGQGVSPERIMYNHGVHGVMDFASMLRRRKRPFEIVAGHAADANTLDAASNLVRAAFAARCLRSTRALRVGAAFEGMGDFALPEPVLAAGLGVRVQQIGLAELDRAVQAVSDAAVSQEIAADRARFACELGEEVHARSVRVGLGLRCLLAEGRHNALSVNFQAFDRADRPANTMPFLEISKAMSRGIGYAGEGDVLTASLVGALARAFGPTTFTEVFCPDWAGDSLFLSHMGEINPAVAGANPLQPPRIIEKPFPFGGSLNPAVLTCAVQPGAAVFVNLAPGPDDSFSLIVAPVEVLADTTHPEMQAVVRAWVRPHGGVARFLEAYSRAGGTHHSALLLGDKVEAVAAFGRMLQMLVGGRIEVVRIE